MQLQTDDSSVESGKWLTNWMPLDVSSIQATPWLSRILHEPFEISGGFGRANAELHEVINQWKTSPWHLTQSTLRCITAREFNQFCNPADGRPRGNKSDLLSQSSLDLVGRLVSALPESVRDVHVYLDRHGGRRYYADAISMNWPDLDDWSVVSESARCSRYRFVVGQRRLDLSFSVQGDRFTPVAMSSLHAKWLREIAMLAVNDYFESKWNASTQIIDRPFRPTAGYPVDADRFIADIDEIRRREGIDLFDLVRSR
ncbi:MAG: hypothetical protein AAGJ40_14445 [Planctomycetota bacterium]